MIRSLIPLVAVILGAAAEARAQEVKPLAGNVPLPTDLWSEPPDRTANES